MRGAVRLGMLGCGSVGDYAVLEPARDDGAISIAAIASRDAAKATAHAARHGIPYAFGSYQAMLDARVVDAIYVALPNAMHREWVIAALAAGYPVLCEKPIGCAASEAVDMVAAARGARQPLVEALHWRHHPLAERVAYGLESEEIGTLERIDAHFHIPSVYLAQDNIRLDPALGGGSTLDQGCYCIDLLQQFGKADPIVLSAKARWSKRGIDLAMDSILAFPNGVEASISTSMDKPGEVIRNGAIFRGSRGTMLLENAFVPHLGNHITIRTDDGETVERLTSTSSYIFQARAFAAIVRNTATAPDGEPMINRMHIIDRIFEAACR